MKCVQWVLISGVCVINECCESCVCSGRHLVELCVSGGVCSSGLYVCRGV